MESTDNPNDLELALDLTSIMQSGDGGDPQESPSRMIHVPIMHDMSYFAEMIGLAGTAGSATVLSNGYLVAEDYPAVHFGVLCRVSLSLYLSEYYQTWWYEGFEPVIFKRHEGGLPEPARPRILCPACLRETERVLREAHGAENCIEVVSGDWRTSTLFFGDKDEIARIREKLARILPIE